ncbi:hypothetical protein IEE92_09260 [Kocuria sp. cx-116]|nr:hypothetical protein [Kocuria sp. cx-116]
MAVLPLHALLLASVALGCVGMAGALAGFWWVLPVAVTVVIVVLVTAAARWLRLPSALVTVLGLAALILALTVVHVSDHALLGFIPTPGTLDAVGSLWSESGSFVARQSAPYGHNAGLALVLSALVGLVTVFMETALLGLRMAGLACVGILALLVVPALTLPGSVSIWGLGAAILAALALLAGSRVWGATRLQHIAPTPGGLPRALLVIAGVLAVSLLVPTVMPGFFSGAFPQGSSFNSERAAGVGPLRAVGQDLRESERVQRFSYTTSDGQPKYMRLMSLSDFSQPEFFPQTDNLEEGLDGLADPETNPVSRENPVTTKVTFEDYNEHWLPAPYAPTEFTGIGDEGWSWNPRDLSVFSAGSEMSGGTFTVTSSAPRATPDAMRSAAPSDTNGDLADYLRVPDETPESISSAARQLTEGAGNDYDRALALQNGLRHNFQYDVNAPLAQGYDAGGMDSMGQFMETRTGYAGHFAPAMALMAREVGIPSRVAVGYLPTAPVSDSRGGELFQVGTGDAHAWPELYFEGVGWVRFEPTPGIPTTPEYAPESGNEPGQDASGQADQTPGQEPSQPQEPTSGPTDEQSQPPAPETPEQAQEESGTAFMIPLWVLVLGGVLLLLVLLAAVPRLMRGHRRRARLADMADASLSPRERANAAWGELEDLSVDHGGSPKASDTPRVRARHMAAGIPAASEAVDRIVSDMEHASYAAPDASWKPSASAADLGTVRDELMRRADRCQKFRATWWPASIFRR